MTNKEAIEKIKEVLNTKHANGINNNALCTVKYIREIVESTQDLPKSTQDLPKSTQDLPKSTQDLPNSHIVRGLQLIEDNLGQFDGFLDKSANYGFGEWIDVHEVLTTAIEILKGEEA